MRLNEMMHTGRMFFVQGGSNRQQEGTVVGANETIIVVEFDEAVDVLPMGGDEVHFAVDGRLLNTVVQRVDGHLVSLVRPEGVELRDVPTALPGRSGFATTCRAADGNVLSAWVLEMSVRGARILAVRDERLRPGQQVVIDLDGRQVRCSVDQVVAHRHPEHAIYQLGFSLVDAAAAPPVARLLTALRSMTSACAPRRQLALA